MASIEVDPDEVTEVGGELVRIAGRAENVGQALHQQGCIGGPPRTMGALASLAFEWQAAAESLESELSSLGQAALAAGFLYRRTDEDVIPVSSP